MKDPAFLFYPNDYLGGTLGMTFEEKGAYIELLMVQFNRGHMTSHMIGHILGQNYIQIWKTIQYKFEIDNEGNYYNKRLDDEKNKRKAYSESRRNNIKGINQHKENIKKVGHMTSHTTSHMIGHMENENVNENIDIIKNDLIVLKFNEICKSLPKVEKLSKSRISKLNIRKLEIKTIDEWINLFTLTEQSNFLTGKSSEWKCSFDWLVENDKNYVKVLEGNYNNKNNPKNSVLSTQKSIELSEVDKELAKYEIPINKLIEMQFHKNELLMACKNGSHKLKQL